MIDFRFFPFDRSISVNRRWLQSSIVIVVLLVSTVVSFWGTQNIYLIVLVLLGSVAAVLTLLRQPEIGFLLVFVGGMLVPFRGPSGLSAATIMIAFMLGLWFMDMFIARRSIRLIRSPVLLAAGVFLFISILALILGQIPWFVFARQAPLNAQVGGFAIFAFSIGCLFLSAHLITNIRWLKIIVWAFLGISAIYIISRAIDLTPIMGLYHSGVTAQSMFWTWIVALALGQVIYNPALSRHARWALVALIALTFYDTVFQAYDWKSGWVPPLVVVGVLLGLRYRRILFFALPFIGIAAIFLVMDLIGAEDYSWGTRVDAWKIVLEIGRVSPLLGMGFANYYWYTPLFPIRGWRVSFNSHSQYVDLIAQVGYVGLLVFFWLFFEMGRLCWSLMKQISDGFALGYVYGVFAGLCATLVAAFLGDWVLPFVYNIGLTGMRASILPWIFMGGVISLEQLYLRNQEGKLP
jgi:hypothetical protein